MAALGTIWDYKTQNLAYILTSVVNNEATWVNITQSPGDFVRYELTTADANPTAIATFAMSASSSINIYVNITAAEDDFSGAGGWIEQGTFRRAAAGGPVAIGETELISSEDFAGGDPDVNLVIVGNTVEVQVTGIAATVINWKADITTIVIS